MKILINANLKEETKNNYFNITKISQEGKRRSTSRFENPENLNILNKSCSDGETEKFKIYYPEDSGAQTHRSI